MFEVNSAVDAVFLIVRFATLVVAIYAFVMSLTYSAEAYNAAGKWTKQGWTIVLGIGVVINIVPIGLAFVGIAFLIAALVFLADVKPALAGLRRR